MRSEISVGIVARNLSRVVQVRRGILGAGRKVGDNGVGDDAWCEEEFEEQEEDQEEEEEGEQEEGEEEDCEDDENAEEKDEAEDSCEEDDEPAHPSRKPVRVARAACPERAEGPAARRRSGASQNAIVAQLDENAVARHLLEVLDSHRRPESGGAIHSRRLRTSGATTGL